MLKVVNHRELRPVITNTSRKGSAATEQVMLYYHRSCPMSLLSEVQRNLPCRSFFVSHSIDHEGLISAADKSRLCLYLNVRGGGEDPAPIDVLLSGCPVSLLQPLGWSGSSYGLSTIIDTSDVHTLADLVNEAFGMDNEQVALQARKLFAHPPEGHVEN